VFEGVLKIRFYLIQGIIFIPLSIKTF
jgi:hypothetical protein